MSFGAPQPADQYHSRFGPLNYTFWTTIGLYTLLHQMVRMKTIAHMYCVQRALILLASTSFIGPLATGNGQDGQSPNIWAIDMTVLELENKRYAIWSGWDAPGTDRQYLYIAQMKSTTELLPPRVRLCENDDFLWERIEPSKGERGLNEGPQVFQNNGSTFIVYSCGASWLNTYKLGLLELIGDNPLDPTAWKKHSDPVFEGNGVGHSCFVKSLDGTELWHVYHAKRDDKPGWRRAIHLQPMQVSDRGMPLFGSPIKTGIELECPSGEAVFYDQASLSRKFR